LNPAENIWQTMRAKRLSNQVFETHKDIVDAPRAAWLNLVTQPYSITLTGLHDRVRVGQFNDPCYLLVENSLVIFAPDLS
jgi:hypothetical protein